MRKKKKKFKLTILECFISNAVKFEHEWERNQPKLNEILNSGFAQESRRDLVSLPYRFPFISSSLSKIGPHFKLQIRCGYQKSQSH